MARLPHPLHPLQARLRHGLGDEGAQEGLHPKLHHLLVPMVHPQARADAGPHEGTQGQG